MAGWTRAEDGKTPPPAPTPAQRLEDARRAYEATRTNQAAVVAFLQASFDVAWSTSDPETRAKVSEEAVNAGRRALLTHTNAAGIHYYLALNLGQLASTRGLSALRLVRDMETHLHSARRIEAAYSHAGPDRALGMLYLEAPGWPVSIGSHAKARTHLLAAVKLAGSSPENLLALAEAHLRWNEKAEAAKIVVTLEKIWPAAKTEFTGPRWAEDWPEWEKRLAALQEKLKPR